MVTYDRQIEIDKLSTHIETTLQELDVVVEFVEFDEKGNMQVRCDNFIFLGKLTTSNVNLENYEWDLTCLKENLKKCEHILDKVFSSFQ